MVSTLLHFPPLQIGAFSSFCPGTFHHPKLDT
ncbi:unnamed protein product [Clonostachys rosea f. rosea IK726]|uniref:Uncharacterized protein n=1 Tax=Clonostachys rosea f. rosea IK726 TaxID=1349383 RepID=A0ACA9UMN2_BIOOC|nr:unnamed protein product [Clonostachys rosea f. rosea IK726]